MAKIKKVWFDANRVYLLTDEGEQLSRPLEAFPVLKDASEQERLDLRLVVLEMIFVGRSWMRMYTFLVSMKLLNPIQTTK